MWKWTESDAIKAIILDIDTLDDKYINYPYENYFPKIKIYYAKQSNIDEVNGNTIYYFDMLKLLSIIICESIPSDTVIAISSDIAFLKEMMRYHIGTIFSGSISKEISMNIPDHKLLKKGSINGILEKRQLGYAAEVLSTGNQARGKYYPAFTISVMLNDGSERIAKVMFGGRYFSPIHNFYPDDSLSLMIRQFKNRYIKDVDDYYDTAICMLNRSDKIDILCNVPLKPRDIKEKRFDRFASLLLPKSKQAGIELENVLYGKADFSQRHNDIYQRREFVKGAFEVNLDVTGKYVVVLDDVYTTGSTINEVMSLLYEKGASKVSAIVIAINQLTESMACEYKNLVCPNCGGNLVLKISKTNKLFFGCNNYSKKNCKENLDYMEGIKQIKKINRLHITDFNDENDNY